MKWVLRWWYPKSDTVSPSARLFLLCHGNLHRQNYLTVLVWIGVPSSEPPTSNPVKCLNYLLFSSKSSLGLLGEGFWRKTLTYGPAVFLEFTVCPVPICPTLQLFLLFCRLDRCSEQMCRLVSDSNFFCFSVPLFINGLILKATSKSDYTVRLHALAPISVVCVQKAATPCN